MFHAAYPVRKASPAFHLAINFRRQAVLRSHNPLNVFPRPSLRVVPKVFLFSGGREIPPARSSTHLKFRPASPVPLPYPLRTSAHTFHACKRPSTREVRAAVEPFSI